MSIRISIITAIWNSVETIGNCIRSVKQQTYPAEHVIIDGSSNDGSIKIIDKLRAHNSIFLSEGDRGFYDALNKGVALAKGDVIGILNADDYYAHKNVLAKVARIFSDTACDSCYGDVIYVDRLDTSIICRTWRAGRFDSTSFHWGWMPPHPTFFVRKRVFDKFGAFNLALGTAADYELMLRFLHRNKISTAYIPEVLVHMRTGGVSNASIRNRLKANLMDRRAWALNGMKPYPWTLWLKPLRKIVQFRSFQPFPALSRRFRKPLSHNAVTTHEGKAYCYRFRPKAKIDKEELPPMPGR